jgi:hypothetical protein
VQHIRWFIQKLEKFDETIAWINKEEGLFQVPISTYPELDELKVCIIFFFGKQGLNYYAVSVVI